MTDIRSYSGWRYAQCWARSRWNRQTFPMAWKYLQFDWLWWEVHISHTLFYGNDNTGIKILYSKTLKRDETDVKCTTLPHDVNIKKPQPKENAIRWISYPMKLWCNMGYNFSRYHSFHFSIPVALALRASHSNKV